MRGFDGWEPSLREMSTLEPWAREYNEMFRRDDVDDPTTEIKDAPLIRLVTKHNIGG